MDRKAQAGVGAFIILFIIAIVALVLFQAIAQGVEPYRTTISVVNASYSSPAAGARIDLTGQELIGTPQVENGSGIVLATPGNYTMGEYVSPTTGLKSVYFESGDLGSGTNVNITYEYGPDGYIDDSGGRSVAGIIVLLTALALAIVVLVPSVRETIRLGR